MQFNNDKDTSNEQPSNKMVNVWLNTGLQNSFWAYDRPSAFTLTKGKHTKTNKASSLIEIHRSFVHFTK